MSWEHDTCDDYYCICPYCGHKHGDCFEWVTEDAQKVVCENEKCNATFIAVARLDITYHGKRID
jgi:hypothetical protein